MPLPGDTNTEPSPEAQARIQTALMRVLKAMVFRDDPGATYGEMPLSQLRCLHIIAEYQGQRMNDLSHRMETKLPAVSQIVDRLVKRGLVERHPDASDRRVVRLELSPRARIMTDEVRLKRERRMAEALQLLSIEETTEVVSGLELMAAAAEKQMALEKGNAPEKEDSIPINEMIAGSGRAGVTKPL